MMMIRSRLKNRILVQDRGGAEFQTGGLLLYVEDLKRGTNPAEKGRRPKDIFEMASRIFSGGTNGKERKSSRNECFRPNSNRL